MFFSLADVFEKINEISVLKIVYHVYIKIDIRGGISSNMSERYVQSGENKKILSVDANKLYGWAMNEYLPYDEIKFDINVILEEILITPDDKDVGYFIEVDLSYPDNIKEKTKNFDLLL